MMTLSWDARNRILTNGREEWALPTIEAQILDALWKVRGCFLSEDHLSKIIAGPAANIQNALRRLRRHLPLFDCFIVSRGHSPCDYRLIYDEFRVLSRIQPTQNLTNCGTARISPSPVPRAPAASCPAGQPDSSS